MRCKTHEPSFRIPIPDARTDGQSILVVHQVTRPGDHPESEGRTGLVDNEDTRARSRGALPFSTINRAPQRAVLIKSVREGHPPPRPSRTFRPRGLNAECGHRQIFSGTDGSVCEGDPVPSQLLFSIVCSAGNNLPAILDCPAARGGAAPPFQESARHFQEGG